MQDSFGMMEGAFFVSRNDLLNWINDLLQVNLTKVEQLGTGSVYCQILDACFAGKVPLNKVNWKAKFEYEFLSNFKILQLAFLKFGIQKQIDVAVLLLYALIGIVCSQVEKLSKARYQDNLEFGQWMKRFYELKFGSDARRDYDARERRGFVTPEFTFLKKGTSPKCILMQHNTERAKRVQDEKVVEKKIKLSQNVGKVVKPQGVEQSKAEPVDTSMLLKEREQLTAKLRVIHQLVNYARESDEALLKKVHDFIGSMTHQPALKTATSDPLPVKQELDDSKQDENNIFQYFALKQEASFN